MNDPLPAGNLVAGNHDANTAEGIATNPPPPVESRSESKPAESRSEVEVKRRPAVMLLGIIFIGVLVIVAGIYAKNRLIDYVDPRHDDGSPAPRIPKNAPFI